MFSRSAFKPRHKNAPRPAAKSTPGFLQWLRGRPCACGGDNPDCNGRMEAAHVDYAAKGTPDAKGTATKVADRWAIPLSSSCHRLQHSKGWPWFDITILKQAGKAALLARDYWLAWPGRRAWEAKQDG